MKSGRLCQFLYELALLLAVLVFGLAGLHRSVTRSIQIDQVSDSTHAVFTDPRAASFVPGDWLAVYRFNPDWKSKIGDARVDSVAGDRVAFTYEPKPWELGRHGVVVSASGRGVTVNLGSNLDFKSGDSLNVYQGQLAVGRLVLTRVGPDSSEADVVQTVIPITPGLGVSEWQVPTQILVFRNSTLDVLEPASLLLLIAVYSLAWLRLKRSPLVWLGESVRSALARVFPGQEPPKATGATSKERRLAALRTSSAPTTPSVSTLAAHAILGIPVVWFGVRFTVAMIVFCLERVVDVLAPGSAADLESAGRFVYENLVWFYLAGGLAYLFVLFKTRTSPVLVFWRRIGFKGGPLKTMPAGPSRDWTIWLLHLIIAYAFAYSLFSFIQGNFKDALKVAWPGSGIELTGAFDFKTPSAIPDYFASLFMATAYMLTHAPRFADTEAAFTLIRDLVFNLTIFGCILGYGHSILGYLWGKRIRNLDFTVTGWITNAICYGPLLGFVIQAVALQMQRDVSFGRLAPLTPTPWLGPSPQFGSGFMANATLSVELLLNVLYMLSIFNLGKMFGVMTDKGVRTSGFYSVVRHPSYTLEAFMFAALWLSGITSWYQWMAIAIIFFLTYWIRSEREDDFMGASNSDYERYRSATPYKFIPGLY